MKSLLALLFIIFNSPVLLAGEIDDFAFLAPIPYELTSKPSQSLLSAIKVGAGDLININVVDEVKKKIAPYKNDLSDYFPKPGELDTFVNNIATEGRTNLFPDNKLTDSKLIKFYEFLGNKLIAGIADKILNTEGVKESSRRELWIKKLLKPFDGCIAKSKNSQYDASHCVDALSAALIPNVGLGLVYELSRSKLSSSIPEKERGNFLNNQINQYKNCIPKINIDSHAVKSCAIESMKVGILKIADLKLSSTIDAKASSPKAAAAIKQAIWPNYLQCTNNVGKDSLSKIGLSTQFINCIDDLILNTGMLMVQDKVLTNSTIGSSFSKAEVVKLSNEKMQSFKTCINDQKKTNNRIDGLLDTDKCENSLTNEVIYKVVAKSLEQTAANSFKDNHALSLKIGNDGRAILDKCWNKNGAAKEREECLRKTILSFAQIVAAEKLDKSIPNELKNKQELVTQSLKALSSCLNEKLPLNISEDSQLTAQTDACSNKLTKEVALQVAAHSIYAKALEQKMSPPDIDELIKTNVDDKFKKCLGSNTTEAVLNKCSTELTKTVALVLATSQIKINAAGKVSPEETVVLIEKLVNHQFKDCIGNNTADANLNKCVGDLTKSATKAIVISYEKKQLKEQLNADETPTPLKQVENSFISCVDKPYPVDKISKSLDVCTKNFSLEFARVLGTLKFNSLLTSVLGTEGFEDQKVAIGDILDKYNSCLENLKKINLDDGLLDKLTICTDALQSRGVNFVSSTVNKWMSSDQKDAATLFVKNEFANFMPCLGGLLPPSPYTEEVNKNVESVLKPVAMLLAQFIEYSPENAKKTLDEIIKKLSTDLKDVATNPASKKELIELLYKNGALDQFLKSMVRGEVKNALELAPEEDLPRELRKSLLEKDNFDKIFATQEGSSIKDLVMEKILKPVLMNQADMKSPLMIAGMNNIKDKVIKLLINSPNFGDQILKNGIQTRINDLGGFSKFFAKVIYGKHSLDWDKVRMTDQGKLAEIYIRDNIMLPKFNGTKLSPEEEKRINAEAEKLVTAAVKSRE